MPALLRQVLLGLGVVLLQWLVFGRLTIWGVVPDVVLIYVALQAIKYGRVTGAVSGFAAGLAMDLLVMPGFLGLNTLLKTVLGFAIGFFRSDRGDTLRLDPFTALIGTLVVAAVHNGLMVILIALDEQTRTLSLVFGVWLGGALYTALVALVGSLLRRGEASGGARKCSLPEPPPSRLRRATSPRGGVGTAPRCVRSASGARGPNAKRPCPGGQRR